MSDLLVVGIVCFLVGVLIGALAAFALLMEFVVKMLKWLGDQFGDDDDDDDPDDDIPPVPDDARELIEPRTGRG